MRDDNDDEDHQSNSTSNSITLTIGKTLHGKGRGTVLPKYLRYLLHGGAHFGSWDPSQQWKEADAVGCI